MTYEEYLASSRGEHYLFGWVLIVTCTQCARRVSSYTEWSALAPPGPPIFLGVNYEHYPQQPYPCDSCETTRQQRLMQEHKALWDKQRAHAR